MGLFSRTVTTAAPAATSDIEASLAPVNVTSSLYNIYGVAGITASRVEFMSVPTCARARNIISSSVAVCAAVASALATHFATRPEMEMDIMVG